MAKNRWDHATPSRGKPRVYIQQFFELRMPERDFVRITQALELPDPWKEEAATRVMEEYLEDLDDGSQCESVHLERRDGIVNVMTVISYPFRQITLDRLLAEYTARKMVTPAEAD